MAIEMIGMRRSNEAGEPDPLGPLEVLFFDGEMRVVASVVISGDGAAVAHALDGNEITALCKIRVGEADGA
ncbi:hypothetical protein [Mangrovicoccus sp. HB161399]|uniref:hypothetical protein n=1 Tax=Mangrovicoccus sp. HB161399 TaxID=2720392 RepID=UPI001551D4CF|nr:hypothetical protein [Mangrovicoccus sp. HB161399]